MIAELVCAVADGVDVASLARGFHVAVADVVARVAAWASADAGVMRIGLTGGVFQNPLLSGLCRARLQSDGLEVLEHRVVPANDAGIALGQAVIAARSGRERKGW